MEHTFPAPVVSPSGDELSPEAATPATGAGEISTEEISPFEARVRTLMGMIADDPSIRDRILCELYVTVSEFGDSFRQFESQMNTLGPAGLLKAMMGGRGKKGKDETSES